MDDIAFLHAFYERVILLQFGLQKLPVIWEQSQDIGPDESVHYFSIGKRSFALIFEDYDGKGRDPGFIQEHIVVGNRAYKFIAPTSATGSPPSYDGMHLPAPYQYCPNVTGTFTLIELL